MSPGGGWPERGRLTAPQSDPATAPTPAMRASGRSKGLESTTPRVCDTSRLTTLVATGFSYCLIPETRTQQRRRNVVEVPAPIGNPPAFCSDASTACRQRILLKSQMRRQQRPLIGFSRTLRPGVSSRLAAGRRALAPFRHGSPHAGHLHRAPTIVATAAVTATRERAFRLFDFDSVLSIVHFASGPHCTSPACVAGAASMPSTAAGLQVIFAVPGPV